MKKPSGQRAETRVREGRRPATGTRRAKLRPNPGSEEGHANPTKQQRSQRSLEKLLVAAEAVLARESWDQFTMNAVAAEAGASIGGIYRRFPSKEHLLRAIKDNALSRADARYARIGDYKATSLNDAVDHFVRNRVEIIRGYAGLLKKILNAQGEDQVMKDRGRQSTRLGFQVFAAMVGPFRSQIAHPNPDLAIEIAFFTMNSTILRRVRGHTSDTIFDHIDWDVLKTELVGVLQSYLSAPRRG